VVTVLNTAAPGNTATWVLDVELLHSIQQARDAALAAPVLTAPSGMLFSPAIANSLVTAAAATFLVANAFDPSVTGLTAPVGSKAYTIDGTKAWLKWGTADRQWAPLHTVSGTVGINTATWDCPIALACNTLGDFEVNGIILVVGDNAGAFRLRLNGATATGASYQYFGGTGGFGTAGLPGNPDIRIAPTTFYALNVDWISYRMRFRDVESSSPVRTMDGSYVAQSNGVVISGPLSAIITTAGEFTSWGWEQVSTGQLGSASTWRIRR